MKTLFENNMDMEQMDMFTRDNTPRPSPKASANTFK